LRTTGISCGKGQANNCKTPNSTAKVANITHKIFGWLRKSRNKKPVAILSSDFDEDGDEGVGVGVCVVGASGAAGGALDDQISSLASV